MNYINTATGQYPYTAEDLAADHPNTTFPGGVAPFMAPVVSLPSPSVDFTKSLSAGQPVLHDGAWVRQWLVEPATPEQIAARTAAEAKQVRADRDRLIAATDWTQLADTSMEPQRRDQWASYRQALRDISKQPGFPWTVLWPTQPT